MRTPGARPVPPTTQATRPARPPRSFDPALATDLPATVETISEVPEPLPPPPKLLGGLAKIAWTAAGLLLSLALGLAADGLIRDLFARAEWLGWIGVGIAAVLVIALLALVVREVLSVGRLRSLETTRRRAEAVLVSDHHATGKAVIDELLGLYAAHPGAARLKTESRDIFDGSELVRLAERRLLAPLDARARALTAASARRVALVTTVSPRALVDIAFVIFESVRLGGAIARLYGARPGFFGSLRLTGAILNHLAVTGGLVLTDGVVEQLVGQGLAAKLSARLGEGIVNGLMTVRVGIAAMRVVRPLPFAVQKQPGVKDFIPELTKLTKASEAQ